MPKRKPRWGALRGVRVLDFTQVLSGPYCTQILADMGADVVKVEPQAGDATRKWGPPFLKGESSYFLSLNRNKRSIAIDLRKKDGVEIAKRLARKCDVVVENFRPGVMGKLGLSYPALRRINRKIIYCSISGYGQTGPLKRKPGYDIAAYAASGIMSITGEEHGAPVKTGVPIADVGAGLFACLAISSSLFERDRTGRGICIDISLYDSMISWLTFQAGLYFATGEEPKKMGSAHPLLVPYQAFRAKDRFFVLAVGSDSIWKDACKVIGIKKLAEDPRFRDSIGRLKNRHILIPILEKRFLEKNEAYWLSRFEEAGVPSSPIASIREAIESEHTRKRKLVLTIRGKGNGTLKSIATPIRIVGASGALRPGNITAPPSVGENSEEVLRDLGYDRREVSLLRKSGTIF